MKLVNKLLFQTTPSASPGVKRVGLRLMTAILVSTLAFSTVLSLSARAADSTLNCADPVQDLIDALDSQSNGDTITLNADVVANCTYTLTSVDNGDNGLPKITKQITIIGNGATIERDASAPAFRFFEVEAAGDLTLNDLTLTGGLLDTVGGDGGAIWNKGNLTLQDATITDNKAGDDSVTAFDANNSAFGGGIYNDGGSTTLTIYDSEISNNESVHFRGGGIAAVNGTINISNTKITGNKSHSNGGGLFIRNVAIMMVNGSEVTDNRVTHVGRGGGFFINDSTNIQINNTLISDNKAVESGGGIHANVGTQDPGGKKVTISNSTISNNTLGASDTFVGVAGPSGAGIHTNSPMDITESTISGNTSFGRGGGNIKGGGMYIGGRDVNMINTTISGNAAEAAPSQLGKGKGGGVYYEAMYTVPEVTPTIIYTGFLTLDASTIVSNSATSNGNQAAAGGGVYYDNAGNAISAGSVTVDSTIIAHNQVISAPGSTKDPVKPDFRGSVISLGYNFFGTNPTGGSPTSNPDCVTPNGANDIVGDDDARCDPEVGPLTDNGGPTMTHHPLPGSPVVDRIDAPSCQANDQRGVNRPIGATCDTGSVEASAPDVTLSKTSASVTEGGQTDTYTVKLEAPPAGSTTVTLTPASSDVMVNPTSLVFDTMNYASVQTVTVSANNDGDSEGDEATTISHSASGGYDPTIPDVSVGVTDNDVAYSITANSAAVQEGDSGSTSISFTIERSGAITTEASTVDYGLSGTATNGDDYTNVVPMSTTISFSAGETSKNITLDVLGDEIDEGISEVITITLSNHTGNGAGSFNPASDETVITDDDNAGIELSKTSIIIEETGTNDSDTVNIKLTSEPEGDVTIGLSTTDTSECTVGSASAVLTTANWSSGVNVVINAVDDTEADGDQNCTVTTAAATSSDDNYNGTDPDNITVTVQDDDSPGIKLISLDDSATDENGKTARFEVSLRTMPTDTVFVSIDSQDTSEGTVSAPQFTFSTSNWADPQILTVTGVDDAIKDGDQLYKVEFTAMSDDTNYDNVSSEVTLSNVDNDVPGITVSNPSSTTTTEAGGTSTFTVVLNTMPSADVKVNIGGSSDTSEGTVDKSSLDFTTSNWNTPQTVTVTGVDDTDEDGDQMYTISFLPSESTDSAYNGLTPSSITLTNIDDDSSSGDDNYLYLPFVIK